MLSVLISWIIIFAASFIFGYGAIRLLYKSCSETLWKPDIYLVFGLMLINVYAQVFSLFYKVGAVTCGVLFAIGIICVIIYAAIIIRGEAYRHKKLRFLNLIMGREWTVLIIIISILATLFMTTATPQHYDTYLYHAQAIRWLEEYGVVPGLGNLHFRFAYNSAFMPLQALFSLKWAAGQSLHTLNGFVCSMAIAYAIGTNNLLNRKKLEMSDLLKIVMLIYIYQYKRYISSPNSDTLAMLLVLYICTKWSEFIEEDVKDALPYTYLCVLCVWAAAIKLSAASCIILAIYPLVLLIKNKQWKQMICNLCVGFVVALPWLIRNIIISGYLLYPYSSLDLFDVDWKMLPSVSEYDAKEIMVWGRELRDVALYDMSISEWFPIWFKSAPKTYTIAGLASAFILSIYIIYQLINRKNQDIRRSLLFVFSIVALFVWLLSAPLFRYGMVYLLIPVCGVIWLVMERIKDNIKLQFCAKYAVAFLVVPMWCIYISIWETKDDLPSYKQENYGEKLTESMEIENDIVIWHPQEGDQGGYEMFPCVPYSRMVEKLELRGDGLDDGFRIKDEYAEMHLNGYGAEW